MEDKNAIRDDWEEYYQDLEAIRMSGVTNMWGASPYLRDLHPELTNDQATTILLNWIHNYDELNKKYGWQ